MTTNYAGVRIGRLTVIERAGSVRSPTTGQVRATWRARCDCGVEVVRQSAVLWRMDGNASCGCLQRENLSARRTKHGMADSRTWISWASMRRRCEKPGVHNFKHYGGRGISVCERWREFSNFLADMGERPPGKSLDRIDVNGNYEPSNCRWATQQEQCRNRRPKSSLTKEQNHGC
jgi:hypothetical protein